MTAPDLSLNEAPRTTARAYGLLLAVFTGAIFVSAALLFAVQPMFTKMVLPRLGGAPAVWSVAIVFFQAALLAGYAYAHALVRYLPVRQVVIAHLAVMAAAMLTLPLSVAAGWGRPPEVGEAFWLIGLFAVSIGLPFFALSANAPLLQAWFARTGHPSAGDPYFLYAASNVGSFLALLSYPVLVEPFVRLSDQTRIWSLGYLLLFALIAGCGALLWRSPARLPDAAENVQAEAAAPPTWRDAATWVALAAVPSGLLVAVTAHISVDVAAVPLLWVLPLALYLFTFIIVFARRPLIPHWLAVDAQPLFIIGFIGVVVFDPFKTIVGLIAVHLAVFFVCVLVCHGELARRRPAARYLTGFYLWMSVGGMIGGFAAALVAPHTFSWVAEYPILIALAVLCRPGLALPHNMLARIGLVVMIAAGVAVLVWWANSSSVMTESSFHRIVFGLLLACVLFWQAPLPFAATVLFVLIGLHVAFEHPDSKSVRSFFGIFKVVESSDGQFRVLQHGTTMHGAQRIRDDAGQPVTGRPEPLLYYFDKSAIAQAFEAVRARKAPAPIRYAVVGLGAGTLACFARPEDSVTYYEIDPAAIRIARDPNLFNFVSECRPDVPVVLGDARLTLEEAPDASYDLIVVDAFSSDAIPIHLLTREAMAIYLKKLAPHGMVVLHVSNRHLELASVVAGIAAANGLITRVHDGSDPGEPYKYGGTVAAVTRHEDDFGMLASSPEWVPEPDPKQWVWTDDYSDIVGAVLRQL
ncbi:MAG: spermidine synthase [Xanthobacteraceae bacterium]